LAATATAQVTPTTDGGFGQEDIYKAWKALPQRFRRNASWMMSVDVNNRVRQMGTSTNFHAYSVNITEGSLQTSVRSGRVRSPYSRGLHVHHRSGVDPRRR
jgi:HK97 family phage major capsid protein